MTRARRRHARFIAGLVIVLGTLGATAIPSEATLIFDLSTTFSGAPPSGVPRATINQHDANTVEILLEGKLSTAEFIEEWLFNFADDASTLIIESSSVLVGSADPPVLSRSNLQADGDGVFDFKFEFERSNEDAGAHRFNGNETIEILLTDTDGGISEADFNLTSEPGGGRGTFFSAAHVLGVTAARCVDEPSKDCTSGWVGATGGGPITEIPAPAAVVLLGVGLLAAMVLGRRAVPGRRS